MANLSVTQPMAEIDRPFTAKQMAWVMDTIAQKATVAQQLCREAIQCTSPNSPDECGRFIDGAKGIIEQIGWMADHHGDGGICGDAPQWMLPPALD